jgi:hypothetical protein
MEIPLGRLRLTITVSFVPERKKVWEEMVAVGLDDLELARLNLANMPDWDKPRMIGLHLIYGGRQP